MNSVSVVEGANVTLSTLPSMLLSCMLFECSLKSKDLFGLAAFTPLMIPRMIIAIKKE